MAAKQIYDKVKIAQERDEQEQEKVGYPYNNPDLEVKNDETCKLMNYEWTNIYIYIYIYIIYIYIYIIYICICVCNTSTGSLSVLSLSCATDSLPVTNSITI